MTDAELAWLAKVHWTMAPVGVGVCETCEGAWPCAVTRLLTEVRRLTAVADAAREWRAADLAYIESMCGRSLREGSLEYARWAAAETALCAAVDALDAAPDVAEITDIQNKAREAERFAEEQRESIRRGARRSKGQFRL